MSRNVSSFLSPRALAQAIGVSESSVKRWADDGKIRIQRTSGGHRRIPVSEAARFVREQGLVLVEPELLGLVIPDELQQAEDPIEAALRRGSGSELRNLLAQRYLSGETLAALGDGPLASAMAHIGELWTEDPTGIFVEHRASSAARDAIADLARLVPEPPPGAPWAVGGSIAGDTGQLGSMMAAVVLRGEGMQTMDLGANTPAFTLVQAAKETGAKLVWLSITHLPNRGATHHLRTELDTLVDNLEGTQVVIGGTGLRDRGPVEGAKLILSMGELAAFAAGLVSST